MLPKNFVHYRVTQRQRASTLWRPFQQRRQRNLEPGIQSAAGSIRGRKNPDPAAIANLIRMVEDVDQADPPFDAADSRHPKVAHHRRVELQDRRQLATVRETTPITAAPD